jgi:hypothetical protein
MYVAASVSCFRCMLQLFYPDVAYVAVAIHMLQAYVLNVLPVSDVCFSKCFMFVGVRNDGPSINE